MLPHRPLRTVQDSFPSSGSSIPKGRPCGSCPLIKNYLISFAILVKSLLIIIRLMNAPSRCYPDAICSSIFKDSQSFLAMKHLPDVCPLSGQANFEPVSTSLQSDIRFFRHLALTSPTVCIAVHLPDYKSRRRYEVTTFRIKDHREQLR